MGRLKNSTPLVCMHSHFTYEERLILEFYLSGKGKLPKITNKVMLGTLLHKHPRTIARELGAGDFKCLFKSITLDNGTEFQDITGIEKSIFGKKNRTTIYFAHPYCASERGNNERHNGIIRRFIPKGSEIEKYSKPKVRTIQDWMNNYPRKILKGKTRLCQI